MRSKVWIFLGILLATWTAVQVHHLRSRARHEKTLRISLQTLAEGDVYARRRAVTTLRSEDDPRVVPALVAALKDSDPKVRIAAVVSLRKFREGSAIEPLAQVLLNPQEFDNIRVCAAGSLVKMGEASIPYLIKALREGDPWLKPLAERSLASMSSAAVEPLLALLKEKNSETRFFVINTLCSIDDPRSLDAILSVLQNPVDTEQSKQLAARYLARLPEIPPQLTSLTNQGSPDVRWWAKYTLTLSGQWRDSKPFVQTLKSAKSSMLRKKAAVEAMGAIADDISLQALSKVLREEKYPLELKIEAVKALGKPGDPEVIAPLHHAFRSSHLSLKIEAINALSRIDSPEAFQILTTATEVLNPKIRNAAYFALMRLNSRKNLHPAVKRLSSLDVSNRMWAAITLSGADPQIALSPLITALNDPSAQVRSAAARSILDLVRSKPHALEQLIQYLQHPAPRIRAELIEIMAQIKEPEAEEAIREALDDPQPEIRQAAIKALRVLQTQNH